MKRLVLFVSIALMALPMFSQNASGTIYFESGKTLRFHKMVYFSVSIKDYGGGSYASLKARYEGTVRDIPFDKLSEFKILQFSVSGTYVGDVVAEITTKTGITFRTEYLWLYGLKVEILDELTGEKKEQQVNFAELGKLNIRRIVFY
jgi:hypothetical protein